MKFKLINSETRKTAHCCFCGTNKSVKYEVNPKNKLVRDAKAYSCNKCVCVFADELDDLE
jgi:hypothetical protein